MLPDVSPAERLRAWSERARLDRVAALAAFVLALCVIPLQFVLSHIYARTLPITLAMAAGLYLLATRREPALGYPLPTLSRTGGRLVETVVFLGVAALFGVGIVAGERTLLFYDLAGVVGSFILLQILFVGDDALRTAVVLVELLVYAVAVRFVALYSYAGYVGIDVWTHVEFIEVIATTGSLRALETKYVAAPLYHLVVLATADLTGLSVRNALYLSVGVTVVAASVAVYYGVRQFVEPRWALFGTALFVMSSQVIRWGINLKPTSLGLVLFVPCAVVLVRILQDGSSTGDTVLFALLAVAITLTNQVAAFILLAVLGTAWLAQFVVGDDRVPTAGRAVSVTWPLVFAAGVVAANWSVTPYGESTFTRVMLERLATSLFGGQDRALDVAASKNVASTAGGEGVPLLAKLTAYLDVFGFLLLLCLAGIGALALLQRRRRTQTALTSIGGISAMSVFILVLPVLGLSLFLPGRWYGFLNIFLVIVGVVGVRYLVRRLGGRTVAAGLVVVALAAPTGMLLAGPAVVDSPYIESKQVRLGFTEQETDAVVTIDDIMAADAPPIRTDSPYTSVFRRKAEEPTRQLEVQPGGQAQHELAVYREYQTTGAPVHTRSARLAQLSRAQVCGPERSVLYTNGDVELCRGG
jgi:hypothetical protein